MFTLSKAERLNKKKIIDQIFEGGKAKSFSTFPIRVVFMPINNDQPEQVQIMISVSKKKFKQAVKRNKIKRQIREGYRLNKNNLIDHLKEKNTNLAIVFIYIASEIHNTLLIENKVKLAISKLIEMT